MTKKSLSKGCKVSLAFEKPTNENYPIKKLKKENNHLNRWRKGAWKISSIEPDKNTPPQTRNRRNSLNLLKGVYENYIANTIMFKDEILPTKMREQARISTLITSI